jgi:RimJ/RimL family protein N-acetyltransferase
LERFREGLVIDLIVDRDETLAWWVGRELDVDLGPQCRAIGFARGGKLLGACVFHNFIWPTIEATIWTSDPSWCNRRTLFAIFWHPFINLKCQRMGATTAIHNTHAQRFLERLGFRREGLARSAMRYRLVPEGYCDAVIYGMAPGECRWLGSLRPGPTQYLAGTSAPAPAQARRRSDQKGRPGAGPSTG